MAGIAKLGLASWLVQHDVVWKAVVGAEPRPSEAMLRLVCATFGAAKVSRAGHSGQDALLSAILVSTLTKQLPGKEGIGSQTSSLPENQLESIF